MKSRWVILISRIGSVLLAVGLALTIVSMLPPAPSGYGGGSNPRLNPNRYRITPHYLFCSPYTGLRFSATSNGSFQIYLLAIFTDQLKDDIISWMNENDPNSTWGVLGDNVSVLKAFISTKSDFILLNETVTGKWNMDYFPPRITNISIVYSNPFSARVEAEVNWRGLTTLANKRRVIIPAGILLAFGVILTLIYAVQQSKQKQ